MKIFSAIPLCLLLAALIACGNTSPTPKNEPPAAETTSTIGPGPSPTYQQPPTPQLVIQNEVKEPSPAAPRLGADALPSLQPTPTQTTIPPTDVAGRYTKSSESIQQDAQFADASATPPVPTKEASPTTPPEENPSLEARESGGHEIGAPVIAIGAYFACALDHDGTPFCWNFIEEVDHPWEGENLKDLPVPPAPEGETFVAISSSDFHVCGLRQDGTVACWGVSDAGEIPLWNSGPEGERFTSINNQGCYTCGLLEDGTPLCWKSALQTGLCLAEPFEIAPPPPGESFIEIAGKQGVSCGLRQEGTFLCWPGMILDEEITTPTAEEDERFNAISDGVWQFCALRQDGSPTCWYWNVVADGWAQGDDASLNGLISISAGSFHACGLRNSGSPVCWRPLEHIPPGTWPSEEERFVAIASSSLVSCGLRADGTHLCWSGGLPE